jgi:hypothetical protein
MKMFGVTPPTVICYFLSCEAKSNSNNQPLLASVVICFVIKCGRYRGESLEL